MKGNEVRLQTDGQRAESQRPSWTRQALGGLFGWVSGLTTGLSIAYVSVGLDSLQSEFERGKGSISATGEQIGVFGSMATLGSIFGSLAAGPAARKFGRKFPCIAANVPCIVGWILTAFPTSFNMMLGGQFLCGLTQGFRAPISRMFLAEMAHPSHRGFFLSGSITATISSQLMMYVAALWLNWQHLAILCILIPAILTPFMFMIPESHVWLVTQGKEAEAEESLQWFYGTSYEVGEELQELVEYYKWTKEDVSSWKKIFRLQYFKPVIFLSGFIFIRQFCGGTVIMQYMSHIFRKTNVEIDVRYCVIVVGFFQLFFEVVAGLLMDKVGRRRCMDISGIVMGLSQGAVGVFDYLEKNPHYDDLLKGLSWLPLLLLSASTMGFALGMATLLFVLLGEVVPVKIKNEVNGLMNLLNQGSAFITFILFPLMMENIGLSGTFGVFSACCFSMVVYMRLGMVETTGKTLVSIEKRITGVDKCHTAQNSEL